MAAIIGLSPSYPALDGERLVDFNDTHSRPWTASFPCLRPAIHIAFLPLAIRQSWCDRSSSTHASNYSPKRLIHPQPGLGTICTLLYQRIDSAGSLHYYASFCSNSLMSRRPNMEQSSRSLAPWPEKFLARLGKFDRYCCNYCICALNEWYSSRRLVPTASQKKSLIVCLQAIAFPWSS